MSAGPNEPSPEVVQKAIAWLVRLQAGSASAAVWDECRLWREAAPEHALAWERLQGIQSRFAAMPPVPSALAQQTLDGASKHMGRRKAMGLLAIAMGTGCTVLVANRQWGETALLADLRTGVGEVRRLVLADGSVMLMDTSTAVNLRFDEAERRLVLIKGRIALTSGADSEAQRYRPLFVQTPHGQVRALGTRFQTHVQEDGTQVQVLSDAVELRPQATSQVQLLRQGEQAWFDALGVHELKAGDGDGDAWTDGLLVARSMPLSVLVAQLGRYRAGYLACDERVAQLPISGVFSLRDTERSLDLLQKTWPLELRRRTRYWVTLVPRG
ncbi:MAG: FecR domain-containing protein [Comamonas testosteroni]|uniref:FecR domain-containing protein n=1 Tax=Comamonas testosteroni TaxID=285 RepID=UPI003D104433